MEKKEILDNQKSDPRPVGRWIIYIDNVRDVANVWMHAVWIFFTLKMKS